MYKLLFVLAVAFFSTQIIVAQETSETDRSLNAGKVTWKPRTIELDSIEFGVPVTREFIAENRSGEDLLISKVRTGCTCTTADYTMQAIPAGKGGVIRITYDAQKEGDFYRIILVTTNFDPAQPVPLILKGTVKPMKK
jgi:Protein of unknown function (DUF1573)